MQPFKASVDLSDCSLQHILADNLDYLTHINGLEKVFNRRSSLLREELPAKTSSRFVMEVISVDL